ncbi:RNA polymerase sigma factor [Pedobacter nyackensis]|uniref:RNA polymerase sigma factor n=1 Tax=Pedobacter nyackensis TaxID=475255 RepID=UPI00292DBD3D|nr:sigma-70 family RNA polymerase sigma factor [Pedobacter nyackensis]
MSQNVSEEEKQLLLDIAGGDRHAFTLLFKKYNHYVYSSGRRLTHSDYWAEELVQDIFFKIWQNREKLGGIENFSAYLNRVVRNHSFNILRQLAQDAKSIDNISSKEIAHTTDEMIDLKEASVILDQALALLTPQQRIAYDLCHIQGLKYQEAALQMNISYETVHSHMKEAIKKIRIHFKARGVMYTILFAILFA